LVQWREFRSGLTAPSLPAIGITLAVPLTAFVACAALITPRRMASDWHRYLVSSPDDTDVVITARALALSQRAPEGPGVFLIGGSSLLTGVASSAELGARIGERVGRELAPEVHELAGNALSILDTAALLDMLPDDLCGVIVLGVNPRACCGLTHLRTAHLKPGEAGGRLGFRTALTEEHARLTGQLLVFATGNYFWDNLGFFLPRLPTLVRGLYRGPIDVVRHRRVYTALVRGEREWQSQAAAVRREIDAGYLANVEGCLDVLAGAAAPLLASGKATVVLLENPMAPRSLSEIMGGGFWEAHVERMRALAAEHGFLYWNLNGEVELTDEDFYDYSHIRTAAARERFTDVLARHIAGALVARRSGA